MTQFHCPVLSHRHGGYLPCDRVALYLVDGTALCRDHAREAMERQLPGSPQPAPDGGPNAKPCTKHPGSTCQVTTQYHYDGPCPNPVEHTTLGELAAKEKHWLCGCGFCSVPAPDGGEEAE